MTRFPRTSSPRSSRGSRLILPGAHRVAFEKAGQWRIYWRASRDRGALTFWSCSAATRGEAEAIEAADGPKVAERYALLAHPRPAAGFMARLIADFKASPDWSAL